MSVLKAPEYLLCGQAGFCPGCGHGIVSRLFSEVLDEMSLSEQAIIVMDVACCSLLMFATEYDNIGAAHGRPIITAAGTKLVRKNNPVLAYLGDGAAYAIGLSHTIWSAVRNDNITAIVVNNGVFGMTGGQMAPTTLAGQKTTSSPSGRDVAATGKPFDVMKVLGGLDLAYLARGSVDSVPNVVKTKKYIRKAIAKQMNNEGFSLVEILSPCPTTWGLSPLDAAERVRNVVSKEFPLGEYVERGSSHA